MKDNDIDKYKPIEGQHEAQNFGEENLKKFVDDFLAGKVPQHYLTEKLPEDWNSKPVKVRLRFFFGPKKIALFYPLSFSLSSLAFSAAFFNRLVNAKS
jgi:hypothetical protein